MLSRGGEGGRDGVGVGYDVVSGVEISVVASSTEASVMMLNCDGMYSRLPEPRLAMLG